jgi:hypothetical protein
MRALLPAVVQAATVLNTDADLVQQAKAALPKLMDLPRTDAATLKRQLSASDDAQASDVVAQSHDQGAKIHNTENVGLEPVWPYSLIGDTGPLHDLEVRTYDHRPNKIENDWSFDPIDSARLGLSGEVESDLKRLTEKYQAYPSGLAHFVGPEFYIEQIGVLASAIQEALVQDYDGLIRIAPAWPKDWDVDGTVSVQHNCKVHVQIRGGEPVSVVLESGYSGPVKLRNPWPGERVEIVSGETSRSLNVRLDGTVITFHAKSGESYVIERPARRVRDLPFLAVTGSAASKPKLLGNRSIGLAK